MLAHGDNRSRIDHDRHAKGLGDGVGGDIVMGRPNAAGGEHIGEARAELVHRRDDLRLEIAYDPHLAQGDANSREIAGDIEDIFVLGAPGHDLFTDDDERGSDGVARCVFHIRRLTYPTLGVLLWTLLEKAQTIDEPGKNASLKHSTGRDGYAVTLALSGFLPKGLTRFIWPRSSRSTWRRRHTCAACLPPTVKFELPEVMALLAGHGACPVWSPANAGPAARIRTVAIV